jgi:hypothetical protein
MKISFKMYYDNTYRNMLDRGFISKRNSENGKKPLENDWVFQNKAKGELQKCRNSNCSNQETQ